MAIKLKRIQTGTFSHSTADSTTTKTLVDRQLGYERGRGSGCLVFNDAGTMKYYEPSSYDVVISTQAQFDEWIQAPHGTSVLLDGRGGTFTLRVNNVSTRHIKLGSYDYYTCINFSSDLERIDGINNATIRIVHTTLAESKRTVLFYGGASSVKISNIYFNIEVDPFIYYNTTLFVKVNNIFNCRFHLTVAYLGAVVLFSFCNNIVNCSITVDATDSNDVSFSWTRFVVLFDWCDGLYYNTITYGICIDENNNTVPFRNSAPTFRYCDRITGCVVTCAKDTYLPLLFTIFYACSQISDCNTIRPNHLDTYFMSITSEHADSDSYRLGTYVYTILYQNCQYLSGCLFNLIGTVNTEVYSHCSCYHISTSQYFNLRGDNDFFDASCLELKI